MANGNDMPPRTGTLEESLGFIKGTIQRIPAQIDVLDQRLDTFKENQATVHATIDRDFERLSAESKQLNADVGLLKKEVADLRAAHDKQFTGITEAMALNTAFRVAKEETRSFIKKHAGALVIGFFTVILSTMGSQIASFIWQALLKLFGGP